MRFGSYQNNIDDLGKLESYRYENIFKIYETGTNSNYYYNILKKIKLPDDLNKDLYDIMTLPSGLPLTTLSYQVYGTTYLWWLIMVVNKLTNPFEIETGKQIKVIKKQYIKSIVDLIQQQLQ